MAKKKTTKSKASKAKPKTSRVSPKKTGRPQKITFDKALLSCISELAKSGKTNEELAAILGISKDTFYRYQAQIGEFSDALKNGKEVIDDIVEQTLLSRALGFTTKETKFATYNGRITDSMDVDKVYPPDTTALIFWLKNRRPEKWRDKVETENTHTFDKEAFKEALFNVIDEE